MIRAKTHRRILAEEKAQSKLVVESLQGKVAELEVMLMACARRLGSQVRLDDAFVQDTGLRFRYTTVRDERARKPGVVLRVGLPATGPFGRGPA